MTSEYLKPLPVPDPDTTPFWEGCKEHVLQAQQCSACGAFRWPPRGLCHRCRSWDFRWVASKGTGTVSSYVVAHYVVAPAFADDAPYVIAQVTLDDMDGAVRLTSNIIDCPWEDARVGMAVEVVFEDVTPEFTLPKFRPIEK